MTRNRLVTFGIPRFETYNLQTKMDNAERKTASMEYYQSCWKSAMENLEKSLVRIHKKEGKFDFENFRALEDFNRRCERLTSQLNDVVCESIRLENDFRVEEKPPHVDIDSKGDLFAFGHVTAEFLKESKYISNHFSYRNGPQELAPEFLRDFEENVVRNYHRPDLKRMLNHCLKGEVKYWWHSIADHCRTFSEFKQRFLTRFWNNRIQRRLRRGLMTGGYSPEFGSVAKYCYYWFRVGKNLQTFQDDAEILFQLSKHFGQRLVDLVFVGKISTLDGFLEFLENPKEFQPNQKSTLRRNWRRRIIAFGTPSLGCEDGRIKTIRGTIQEQSKATSKATDALPGFDVSSELHINLQDPDKVNLRQLTVGSDPINSSRDSAKNNCASQRVNTSIPTCMCAETLKKFSSHDFQSLTELVLSWLKIFQTEGRAVTNHYSSVSVEAS